MTPPTEDQIYKALSEQITPGTHGAIDFAIDLEQVMKHLHTLDSARELLGEEAFITLDRMAYAVARLAYPKRKR